MEVIVNGCHSKDPSLKKYCTDPSTDMHRDGGMDIFEMTKEELLDEYRSNVKGLYIFSEFYGNWYGQVAKDLWDYIQETPALLAHMKSKGYRDYATFEYMLRNARTSYGEPDSKSIPNGEKNSGQNTKIKGIWFLIQDFIFMGL